MQGYTDSAKDIDPRGGRQMSVPPERPDTPLDSFMRATQNGIRAATQRVSEMRERVERVGNRVFGPQAETPKDNPGRVGPIGGCSAAEIQLMLNALETEIARLSDSLNRLA